MTGGEADDETAALSSTARQHGGTSASKDGLGRTCKDLLCRTRSKRTKSCSRIFCSDFLAARAQALRFKTNFNLFIESENKLQKHYFIIISSCMLSYFVFALAFPLIFTNVGRVACSPASPMAVYGTYCAYILMSTFGEMAIISGMKRVVNAEQKSAVSCNRYVIAKWLQGQLANLCTFVHLCFIASAGDCFRTGADTVTAELDYLRGGFDKDLHRVDAAINKDNGTAMVKAVDPTAQARISNRALMVGLSSALALLAVPVVVGSHYRRVKYVWKSIKLQPTVHRLLPNAYRNSQLAWLCNLQAANVVLESISLSDYMLAYGGRVVAGK